jgi:predicted RNA-binding Zn ribbon-like protein
VTSLASETVTSQDGDVTFDFIADRPVLNFLPTIAARGTVDEEKLREPTDLADWIVQSGLLDRAPRINGDDLDAAKALREVLFRMVAALIDGPPLDAADLAAVNAAAAVPPPVLRIDDAGVHREGGLDAVLAVLARDGLDLSASPDRAQLHWCADETCTRPFVDRSRGHRRRWCGMKGCGDRAKAAAYRRRQRDTSVEQAGRKERP